MVPLSIFSTSAALVAKARLRLKRSLDGGREILCIFPEDMTRMLELGPMITSVAYFPISDFSLAMVLIFLRNSA